MTAAVYAARKKMDLAMIAQDLGGQATWSWSVENYMGFSYIKGVELMNKFEEHMKQFGFPIEYTKVEKIERAGDRFVARREDGKRDEAVAVIVASGKSPRKLGVQGEERLIGRGVTYCSTCDAPIFTGMDVAVIGGGNSALSSAIQLLNYAKTVAIVSYEDWTCDEVLAEQVAASDKVKAFKHSEVVEVLGDQLVEGIRVRSRFDGSETMVPIRGIFVEIGQVPNSAMVKGLAEITPQGEVVVDCSCRTNVEGLLAAGDVTTVPEKQIIVAAGEGAKAALTAYEYVIRHRASGKQQAA